MSAPMIRHRHGSDFFLFTQHDHALLSGQLAERIGGGPLDRPSPRTIQAIALHDSGWPLHDDEPTLNAGGEPLHVFETPPQIGTRVWGESAQRAAVVDPYIGLLVSLHVLHLSLMAQAAHQAAHDVFELNKFQHKQIELQEKLRPQVGLRIDRPLTHGLAPAGESPQEDELRSDFQLLRTMDSLSLALLCSKEMAQITTALVTSKGGAVTIKAVRPSAFTLVFIPWIFAADSIELPISFRRVSAEPFTNLDDFRLVYERAAMESATLRILP
jgi:hypothetical protein